MDNQGKTHEQLVAELAQLCQRVAELEASEAECRQTQARLSASEKKYRELYESMMDAYARDIADRKRVEEFLHTSEERYRRIVETAREGIWIIDAGAKTTFVNQRMADMLGYMIGEMLYAPLFAFMDEKDYALAADLLERRRQGIAEQHEFRFRRRDGTDLWAILETTPILDEHKKFVGALAMVTDITERKRAEEEIRRLNRDLDRRNQELLAINQASRAMASTLDLSAVLQRVIGEVRTLLDVEGVSVLLQEGDELVFAASVGIGSEGLVGTRMPASAGIAGWALKTGESALVGDTQRDSRFYGGIDALTGLSTSHLLAAPLTMEGVTRGVIEAINKTGGAFDPNDLSVLESVAASAAIAVENARLYEAAQRELRERKRAEEALRESEEQFRTLAENSPNMIFINRESRIVYVNDRCVEMMGYSKDEFYSPQFDFMRMVASEYHPLIADMVQRHAVGEDLSPMEYAVITRQGERIEAIYGSRCITYQGKPAVLGVITDITERKRAEEALRESEELYRQTISSISDAVFLTDDHGDFVLVCPYIDLTFGWSVDEVMAMGNLRSLIGNSPFIPDELDGELQNVEWNITDKSGHPHSLLVHIKRVHIGKATRLYACRDITDRKRAEEALRASEERYHIVSELTSDFAGAFRIDLDGTIMREWLTGAYTRITGFAPGEMDTHGIWVTLVHPDDMHVALRHLQTLFSGQPDVCELRIITQGGEERWLRNYGRSVWEATQGRVIRIYSASQDITERKRAEQSLEASEERYRGLFQNASMGIFHSLPEERFLRVNPALAAMCGYDSPEEMVSTITNIPKQLYVDPPRYTELRGLTLKQDEWVHAENRYRRKDGSLMIGNLSLRKVLNPDGTVAYLEGFVEDITVRKRTEEERGRLAEQLRQLACYLQSAREQERAFIAREIHDEFGQALTALKIDLSWLSRRLPKQRADLLDKVNAMSKLVDGTTQTVRRIATELRPGLLDDLGLVAAIEWQAQEFAERTGLACELRLGDKDLALDPDLATTLFRILQEALTNIARHARATRIEVELDDRPDLLTLVVRDNGKGIDPAQVFDSHSLGLMGMRERARVWGGDVVVEGIPGQGTTVIVRIPQTSEVSETSEVGQPQEAQP